MIGRTLSEEGAAALRARFLVSNPQTPQEMLTAALGTTAPVDLGRGLTLTRRRVAGEMRLELCGVDRGMIDGLKSSLRLKNSEPSPLRVLRNMAPTRWKRVRSWPSVSVNLTGTVAT
jgi:hypothetical protein